MHKYNEIPNIAGNKRNVKLKQQLTKTLKTKHDAHEAAVKLALSVLMTEAQLGLWGKRCIKSLKKLHIT